jgi:hypothetical protein
MGNDRALGALTSTKGGSPVTIAVNQQLTGRAKSQYRTSTA